MVGVDEAGRGSLVGPLVAGAFVTTVAGARSLPDLGVRDSKALSPAERDRVYRSLAAVGRRLSISLDPSTIDRHVDVGQLNELEAITFGRLVRRSRATHAFVDACDPVAPRFGAKVRSFAAREVTVTAVHHADRDIPVVGAASIVAKVRRDRALARLRRRYGTGLGSGYPSDGKTVEFVRIEISRRGVVPEWVRASWSTTQRLFPKPPARTLETFAP